MSEELKNYLDQMESYLSEVENSIQRDFDNKKYEHELDLLLNNNEKVRKYITQLTIGPNLTDEKDNMIALDKIYKRHIEFMKFYYDLVNWNVIR